MDDSLRLIQHLYGEEGDDPAFAQRLQEDEALRREYEELQDTKAALDRRSSPSPDPDVVDGIMEHAREAAGPDGSETPDSAPDRAARAPERTRRRRLQGVSAVLAVLLLAGVGWWQFRTPDAAPAGTTAGVPAAQSTEAPAAEAEPKADDGMPEWDDRDEVVRLHRRIEMLRTQNHSDGWGGGSLQAVDRTGP